MDLTYAKLFCHSNVVSRSLNRTKLFVVGDLRSGKSSLVQSLIGTAPKLVEQSTEGVSVEVWSPFKNSDNGENLIERTLTEQQRHLLLEIWDLSGRQVCQKIHPIYFTEQAVYIVVCSQVDQASIDHVLHFINTIQGKVPGSVILIVSTHLDKDTGIKPWLEEDDLQTWLKNKIEENEKIQLSKLKKELEETRAVVNNLNHNTHIKKMEKLLHQRPLLSSQIHLVSNRTGQGLKFLKRELLQKCTDIAAKSFDENTVSIYNQILRVQESGTILLPWKSFQDTVRELELGISAKQLEEQITFLTIVGGLLDLRLNSEDYPSGQHMCLQPQVFANALCSYHVDNIKKTFKIEANRFWPRKSGFRKPEPSVLIKALECIPLQGVVREVLFPLLWQDIKLNNEQVQQMLKVSFSLGLLMPFFPAKNHYEGLALPDYPSLSVLTTHYAPLMDLLADNRPQLNWTPKPFKGDLQVTCCIELMMGEPPLGLLSRAISCCHQVLQKSSTYKHLWQKGILTRLGETLVCVEQLDNSICISCRVNEDEPGHEQMVMQMLWIALALTIKAATSLLETFQGLIYKTYLVPLGQQFYAKKVELEPKLCSLACLQAWQNGQPLAFQDGDLNNNEVNLDLLFPFRRTKTIHSLSDWLDFVLLKTGKGKFQFPLVPSSAAGLQVAKVAEDHQGCFKSKIKNRQKTVEIKWKLDDLNEKAKDMDGATELKESVNKIDANNLAVTESPIEAENSEKEDTPSKHTESVDSGFDEVSIKADGSINKQRKFINEDEEIKAVTRLASGFVAAIMASAVAHYIATVCAEQEECKPLIGATQVAAAQVTAQAAMATQAGDIDAAMRAVLEAVQSTTRETFGGTAKSKLCTLL